MVDSKNNDQKEEVESLFERQLKIKNSLSYKISEASAFSAMQGFGSFLGAYAIALNATTTTLAFIASLPEIAGSFFQLLSTKAASIIKNRRILLVNVAFFQALLWIPIMLIPFIFTAKATLVLLLFVVLINICSMFLSPISTSLVGDLVKKEERARYLGIKSKYVNIFYFIATFGAGLLLNRLPNKLIGFSIIFFLAFVARIVSVSYLKKVYEPGFNPPTKDEDFSFFQFLRRVKKTNFGRFVIFLFFFRFSVNIVAPFFALYMLKDLHLDYIHFTLIILAPIMAAFLTMSKWGQLCYSMGSKNVMTMTGFLLPLIPILWVLSPNFYYLFVLEFLGGIAWAGFNLSVSNFTYDATTAPKRIKCVSYLNLLNSAGIFLGAVLGGFLLRYSNLSFFTSNLLLTNNILILCVLSGVLRLIVSLAFLPTLKEARLVELFSHNEPFFKRVVAIETTPRTGQIYEPVERINGFKNNVKKETKKDKETKQDKEKIRNTPMNSPFRKK